MSEFMNAAELDHVAQVVSHGPYEGYPRHEHRLFIGSIVVRGNTLIVPEGPWHVRDHVNRHGKPPALLDPEVPSVEQPSMSAELAARWLHEGLMLDQYGRPIHPDWRALLSDRRIGLPTGLGFFWRYGSNKTVDGAIYRDDGRMLLIKRQKGGQWALPGGFMDRADDSAAAAARREVEEETGLDQSKLGAGKSLLKKRGAGLRTTLHAWTENEVVVFNSDQEYLHDAAPEARDDALDVGWFTHDETARLNIFDAHQSYIDETFAHYA